VHVDHLARPIKMTDAAKAQAWDAVWAPWGSPHAITGPAALDARFPGQWFQLEAGLHYNWHRHYDASLGRYTQADPLGLVDGPSVYGYADADPLTTVDPAGQSVLRLILEAAKRGAPAAIRYCFGRKGLFNSNQCLRIGRSFNRVEGTPYFSVRGKWVDSMTGQPKKHFDLFKWTLD